MTQKIQKTVRVQSYFRGDIYIYIYIYCLIMFIVISVLRLEYLNLR